MTTAAIYSRFSSENQRDSSIEDQARNCERRAKLEGWSVVFQFADKGISGSQDERKREGYQAMLKDAEAGRFDVLLVDDLSRLSRDEAELIRVRRRLQFWRVRLVGVSDGFDTAQKGHKIQAMFHGLKNEMYLDELKDKTRRGLEGQALKGFHTGGRTFGYKHVPILDPTRVDAYGRPFVVAVKREIDEAQAKWVRHIFQWYADGKSPRWMAGELNRLGVAAPGAAYRRRHRHSFHGTWSFSVLHGNPKACTGLLNNPIYIGKVVWNRREWERNPETNKKIPRLRPESEWVVTEQPELRIVPQVLWEKAQARRRAYGKPSAGRPSKFLFSGLLKCGAIVETEDGPAPCGSSFVMASYTHYACASHLNGRNCANTLRVAREKVETLLLAGIKQDLFTPDAYRLFVKETTCLLAERQRAQKPKEATTKQRLAAVEQEIEGILKAIKIGVVTKTTKAELERLEAEQNRLTAQIKEGVKPTAGHLVTLLPDALNSYRAVVEKLERLPERYVDAARVQIKRLVGDRIMLVPSEEGHLVAELQGNYVGLLKLAANGSELNVKCSGCGGRI